MPDSSRYISRKKLAVTLGIKASKYEWLVFTNANCMPQSNQWLRLMARNFTSRTQVVLGYSGYERGKGWLHKRVAFDNLFTSMRYLGFALAGSPYMGIGVTWPTGRNSSTNRKDSPHTSTCNGETTICSSTTWLPGEHAGRNGCQCHCTHATASACQGLERRENRLRLHSTAVSWDATLAGRF